MGAIWQGLPRRTAETLSQHTPDKVHASQWLRMAQCSSISTSELGLLSEQGQDPIASCVHRKCSRGGCNPFEETPFGRPFALSFIERPYFFELGLGSMVALGRACFRRSCSAKTRATYSVSNETDSSPVL